MAALRTVSRTTIFAVTAVLLAGSLACAYLADVTGNDTAFDADVRGWLIVSAVSIAVAAGLILKLVPNTEADPDTDNKPARIGLVLAVASLVLIVVFWTGLPIAVGVPALVLGADGLARSDTQGRATEAMATVVIASIATFATIVFCVIG